MLLITLTLVIVILVLLKQKRDPFDILDSTKWTQELGPDGLMYIVRPSIYQKQVAAALSKLHSNVTAIMEELKKRKDNQTLPEYMVVPTANLIKKYSHKIIREGFEENEYTSFSVDKREIHFCIRSRDGNNMIYDDNLLLYVGIHEISHLACPSEGHTKEFTQIFAYLLGVGQDVGVYTPVDFRNHPTNYCGLVLNKS